MESLEPDPHHPPRGKSRVWIAAIPAFLLTMGSMGWSVLRYAGVLPALDGFSSVKSHARACASAYGLTVYNSEHYISADRAQTSASAKFSSASSPLLSQAWSKTSAPKTSAKSGFCSTFTIQPASCEPPGQLCTTSLRINRSRSSGR